MKLSTRITSLLLLLCLLLPSLLHAQHTRNSSPVRVGADQIVRIKELCKDKKVGIATNATAILSDGSRPHLIDTLLTRKVNVRNLYSPEHGLTGKADAGEALDSQVDPKSKLPVISLYGSHLKPTAEDLSGIDIMLFDMQDVGCRFYTYISTLCYLLEACADQGIPVVILDRPNPHDYIDGPLLKDKKFRSFVGMLPIPVLHGLTLGEAALMMKGEGWLNTDKEVNITVVPLIGWKHGDPYSLPVAPSPNLKSDKSILYYPTLCYLEGTSWSVGRGTDTPFEVAGYPHPSLGPVSFTPRSVEGAKNPPLLRKKCYGPYLDPYFTQPGIRTHLLIDLYKSSTAAGVKFITRPQFFDKLAGTDQLRRDIESGKSAAEIEASWAKDLRDYAHKRSQYLLYPDERTFYWQE